MTPAGTSNELDVQNEWEENTHTLATEKRVSQALFAIPVNPTMSKISFGQVTAVQYCSRTGHHLVFYDS